MARRVLLMAVVASIVSLLAFSALAEDVCEVASRVMPESCVTQADLFVTLNQVFGNCGGTTVEEIVANFISKGYLPADFTLEANACVTKGFVSQILYHALGLRPGLIERVRIAISGLTPKIALKIAQDNALMVLGDADENLTGAEFVACIFALVRYELHTTPLPCTTYRALKSQLDQWLVCIQQVMPLSEAATYIPGLIHVPTS